MRGQSPAKLVLADGDSEIVIRPENASAGDAIACRSWDLGAPETRAASAERNLADGTIDSSAYTGARTVTFDLIIRSDQSFTAYTWAEKLAALTHPSKRPVLRITRSTPEGNGKTYEMVLRGNPFSLSFDRQSAGRLEMQLSFTAPLGYLEGPNQVYKTVNADKVNANVGIKFPVSFPFTTGQFATETPLVQFVVGGSAPVYPVLYIYGPAVNPQVADDTGEIFEFANLTLAAGQFVRIDMAAATVLREGSADANAFHAVDWMTSTFWRWLPGRHSVRYIADSGTLHVHFRERRYTI